MKAFKLLILFPYLMLQIASAISQNNATAIRVIDGDTYQVLKNKKVLTVRLMNVDAPELKQKFGTNAKDSVSKLIMGKTIKLDSLKLDRYNRVLGNIEINGIDLESILIAKGWAWFYAEYSNKIELEKLQIDAINKHLGLWQCGKNKVCPPSIFRKSNEKNRIKYCSGCKN